MLAMVASDAQGMTYDAVKGMLIDVMWCSASGLDGRL